LGSAAPFSVSSVTSLWSSACHIDPYNISQRPYNCATSRSVSSPCSPVPFAGHRARSRTHGAHAGHQLHGLHRGGRGAVVSRVTCVPGLTSPGAHVRLATRGSETHALAISCAALRLSESQLPCFRGATAPLGRQGPRSWPSPSTWIGSPPAQLRRGQRTCPRPRLRLSSRKAASARPGWRSPPS